MARILARLNKPHDNACCKIFARYFLARFTAGRIAPSPLVPGIPGRVASAKTKRTGAFRRAGRASSASHGTKRLGWFVGDGKKACCLLQCKMSLLAQVVWKGVGISAIVRATSVLRPI